MREKREFTLDRSLHLKVFRQSHGLLRARRGIIRSSTARLCAAACRAPCDLARRFRDLLGPRVDLVLHLFVYERSKSVQVSVLCILCSVFSSRKNSRRKVQDLK